MTQDNTIDEQQAINRLIGKDNSIARHDFSSEFYIDSELIMMVIKN